MTRHGESTAHGSWARRARAALAKRAAPGTSAAAQEVLRQAVTHEPPCRRNTVYFSVQGREATAALNTRTAVTKPSFSLVLSHRDA